MVQYLLGEQALKQLADTVKRVAKLERVVLGTGWNRDVLFEQLGVGKLDEELEIGGVAELSVYKPDPTGGIGMDTGETITVVDADGLSANLPEDTIVYYGWIRGCWVVIGHKCV